MSDFYTSVQVFGDHILFRGVVDGKRKKERIKYQPSLFVPTQKQSKFKTIYGNNLEELSFESIRDAKDFVSKYDKVPNFPIYGMQSFEYAYIAKEYPDEIVWDTSKIIVANIDIEVGNNKYAGTPNKKVKIRKRKK